MKNWEIIYEMDDEETGLPTCYAKEFDGQFFWATQCVDGWHAETKDRSQEYSEYRTLKVMRTSKGIMRWIEKNYKWYLYHRKEN